MPVPIAAVRGRYFGEAGPPPIEPVFVETFDVTDDAYINRDAPTSQFGSGTTLPIGGNSGGQTLNKAVLRFNLEQFVGKEITFASIRLYAYTGSGIANITASRILPANSAWTNLGVTWNTQNGSTAWSGSAGCSTPGVDYSATPLASGYVQSTPNDFLLVLDLTEFVAMVNSNRGIVFHVTDEAFGGGSTGSRTFRSSNYSTIPTNRPRLWVFHMP